jgi:2,4-dienoyl-CoA reductase-like NADH-dependent reductase (Old Yellow Enzyme family)
MEAGAPHYPFLFRPFTAGPLTLSNRIVVPPLVTSMATDEGMMTREDIAGAIEAFAAAF